MKHCFATNCEDDCNVSCESYICKKGATEGAPVPGTDGKVCYGNLVLPQSLNQVYDELIYGQAYIDPESSASWVGLGSQATCFIPGIPSTQTMHLIHAQGISTSSSRDTPLGIIQNWSFGVSSPITGIGLIFEFGFAKVVSSQFIKIGAPKQRYIPLNSFVATHSFSLGSFNDLWGISPSDIKTNVVYPSVKIIVVGFTGHLIRIGGPLTYYPNEHQFFYYRDGACLPPSRP